VIDQVNAKAHEFLKAVKTLIGSVKRDLCLNNIGSMSTLFFRNAPVTNYQDAVQADTEQFASFFNTMLNQGIYIAPSQFEAMFISLAHSEEDFERTLTALKNSLTN
jgi:glutamate-1-semialdehyde 2,1-aminomutase